MTEHTCRLSDIVHPNGMTAEGKRWIEAVTARQNEMLKEPALPDRQKQALNARALAAFGTDITFAEDFRSLVKDTVFPVLLKYTQGFTPRNPTFNDIRRSGGYAQEQVHLALAKVVNSKEDYPIVEVQFESPMFMSYKNGITTPSTNFLLCEDGTIQYFSNGWKQWNHHVPTWEFVQFPALKEDLIHWPVTDQSLPPRNLQEEFKRACAENGYFDGPYETLEQLQEWYDETYGD